MTTKKKCACKRTATRKRKPTTLDDLGGYRDNPYGILYIALSELYGDGKMAKRQAAEKAYLAMTSAVSQVAGRDLTYEEEQAEVERLAGRSKAKNLKGNYEKTRNYLHGQCYHRDKCGGDRDHVKKMIDKASDIVDAILAAGGVKLPKQEG